MMITNLKNYETEIKKMGFGLGRKINNIQKS